MKLIIDIPEDMYQTFHNTQPRMGDAGMDSICQAIGNGTPLDNETVDVLDKIRAEILEEKEYAYADFDQYKVDYLGVDSRYVEDELPYDDFRYGMERCVEIINKYREGSK